MTASSYALSDATPKDLADILALQRYVFPPEVAFSRDYWQKMLRLGKTWLVRHPDGKLCAYLTALEHRRSGALLLQTLAVHWEHRHKGLARNVLTVAQLFSVRRGLTTMVLEVAADNTSALALYRSFGFELQLTLPDYYGAKKPGLRLRKTLS